MRFGLAILLFAASFAAANIPGRSALRYFDPARPIFTSGPERSVQLSFPLMLRIGLEERQDSVTLTCPAPFRIVYADQALPGAPQERWTFRIRSSQPAEIEYFACVKTHHLSELGQAQAEVAAWKARGYKDARVLVRGALMLHQGATVHDNRGYVVVVSVSRDPVATDQVVKRLQAAGERPLVLERLLEEPEGIIELTGPGGRTVVSRGPFEIRCEDRVRVFQVEHDIGYPWYGRQDREYAGSILVMIDRWGKLVVINRVEMEKYLTGVVPCEIDADAPLEAHKTQAVCARGEVLANYGIRHPADPYDFFASQADQQYAGLHKETPLGTQAVQQTLGEVLKTGVKIVNTVYSGNCGGHTEDNDIAWSSPPSPNLRAVADAETGDVPSPVTAAGLDAFVSGSPEAYCRDPRDGPANKYRWKVTLPAAEVDRLVAAKGHGVGAVTELRPLTRGRSGRIRALEIVGAKGTARVEKELTIRQLLGGLRSALFVVRPGAVQNGRPSGWTFVGAGWGHGVGMCQMGARGMARASKSYGEILRHYYGACELADLY